MKQPFINRLNTQDHDFLPSLQTLLAFDASEDKAIEEAVTHILEAVKQRGDEAVLEFTQKFDRSQATCMQDLEVTPAQMKRALDSLDKTQREDLEQAADRIRRYHEKQKLTSWQYTEEDGTVLGQKVTPLDKVGLYVPGGKAAYPSSVMMNAIPAKVAGVGEIIMVSPTPNDQQNDLVLACAAISGVDRVIRIGGAQAIAALAYGTECIPQVDKITGPGNAYVASAKKRVFGTVGIDMVAGPSEILIICDGSTSADWIAMDLFSQAEHDELAQAILLSPDEAFLDAVQASMQRQIANMPREAILRTSLSNRGILIKVKDLDEACDVANRIAPEHLEISTTNASALAEKIHHAGALFLGAYSSESFGDYCAGPNHTLPTARTARFSSPLGVYDFQKRSSIIQISEQGAKTLGPLTARLAYGEGLQAHAHSAEYRFKKV
ncbi:histidinol dehydrogenase [Basilea psittacipulmonis]|uniref:Histidinol dehydrogenase n=1 Tax=Basilea psittacipulmonis DSM 24701 TaxID=1072685 RepID=A0A077DGR4_9BURK|nr:histidinol dehydrogenase [Basilea psittacipulmonis]AIL33321.1 histidinol dehydrogenase [Basilea psittacipulmonis DSM 24701]